MFLEHQTVPADHVGEREALVARATAEIARHHSSTALTPASLAGLLSVSLRHLQRAFGENGITIARSIMCARVRTAAMLLSSPDAPELTIAEVAYRSGFRSTFELRSAFRVEHGVLPSEFRSNPQVQMRA
jgi:AraC-like DNA-binding protein